VNQYEPEVVIVGAGPSGLAAAIELRKLGVSKVMVVDREKNIGGIPRHCNHIGFGMRDMRRLLTGPAYAARYMRLAEKFGVDIQSETSVTGWCDSTHLIATRPDGRAEIKASAVILATGCRERPRSARLIPGSRPAGIFTTGALQNFVYIRHHPVGKRAIVVGADHVGFSAIMTLKHAKTKVLAMVTDISRHQSFFAYKLVSADRYGIPVLTSQKVTRIFGKKRVEAVELTNVITGNTQQIDCDTIVFTGDWIPDHELARWGGLAIDPHSKSPRVDLQLRTSAKGVFAVGNLVHAAETADVAALSGVHAAGAVRDYLETGNWPTSSEIPIEITPPIEWVSPHMICSDERGAPSGHFVLRVKEVLTSPTFSVWQGDRCLWQKSYPRLIPNLPLHISDHWIKNLHSNTETVRLELK
jgi:thioredoxin reductase